MKPATLLLVALACTGLAAAYSADQCRSYLTGRWTLEGNSWITYDFGANGTLVQAEAHTHGPPDETRSTWSAADGAAANICAVTLKHEGGKTEELDFKLTGENTFSYRKQAFKRLSGSGASIRFLPATGAAFDTSTCPTYFTGSWRGEKAGKTTTSVMQMTFGADGAFNGVREDRGRNDTDRYEIVATWRSAAGPGADQCTLTLTPKDSEGASMPMRIRSKDSFLDEKEGFVFTRQ